MFEKEKQQMLDYALKMDRYGLIALSGGNLSWRMPTGEVIVTPSGIAAAGYDAKAVQNEVNRILR